MAKKNKKNNKNTPAELPANQLPQNILPMGERVEENKNIYISQSVYKEIRKFTRNKTTNESGGMLIGTVVEELGKTNILISGFIEAKHCEATPTTLKFTHETWDHVHKELEKKHKGKKIVGWIHTHPDFGIFLSEYDKFIHENFFSEAYQIAYVVDPIQNIEGFYFWINSALERCKGFYIYDKAGTRISIDTESSDTTEEKTGFLPFSIKNAVIAILAIALVFLTFSNISTNNELERLERRQDALVSANNQLTLSANNALASMQQQINEQEAQIQGLIGLLVDAGIIVPATPEADSSEDAGTEDGEDGSVPEEPTGDAEGEDGSGDNGDAATEPEGGAPENE